MGVVARCSISAHASLCFGAATGTRTSPSSPRHRTRIHLEPRCTSWRFKCRAGNSSAERDGIDWASSPTASPYQVLGVDPAGCSQAELKAAFRARYLLPCILKGSLDATVKLLPYDLEVVNLNGGNNLLQCKVKEFHPDLSKDKRQAEMLIKRVIKAYEILSKEHPDEPYLRPGTDPFEEPECEAYDLFLNEFQCFGKGCPYSCAKTAPEAFALSVENGTARVISQDHGNDYRVQLAVGQCPRRCIHYVTPAQRAILEDILQSALNNPFDLTETRLLDSLISEAKFENNRYQKPKRKPKISTEYVDWI